MDMRSDQHASLLLRIAQFPLVRIVLLLAILFYLYFSGHLFRTSFAHGPWQDLAVAAWMSALALAVYAGFVRVVERRQASEVSVAGMGGEVALGMILGAGLYTASVLVLIALGNYRIDGLNGWHMLLPAMWFGLTSGVFEELFFRGVVLRITEETFGSWVGLAASALVFGLVHLNNPEATLKGALFISVEFGLLLGAAYILTRRLWLGIGIHSAWNYTQSAVFAGAGSGNEAPKGLVRATIEGPDLLTGGSFGMEASLGAFVLATATGVIMLIMAAQRGRIVPPVWKRLQAQAA